VGLPHFKVRLEGRGAARSGDLRHRPVGGALRGQRRVAIRVGWWPLEEGGPVRKAVGPDLAVLGKQAQPLKVCPPARGSGGRTRCCRHGARLPGEEGANSLLALQTAASSSGSRVCTS